MKNWRSVSTAAFIWRLGTAAIFSFLALVDGAARADEGGVSFWVPGLFGSLAAVPSQAPAWSVTTIYWHDSVSAGADVARAREVTIGGIPANFTANVNANLNAKIDVGCDGRTVQRWLAEHGSSFSEILDAQRSEMVVRLIEDQSRSLPAVAELLGFSAQSALARWFRERFGCSITQWRTNAKTRSSLQ